MTTVFHDLYERYPALETCSDSIADAFKLLLGCFQRRGTLWLCGNGGSGADAEHIAGELMKGFLLPRPIPMADRERLRALASEDIGGSLQCGLPSISLMGHLSLSTAVANDNDPNMIFAQQLYTLGREGDVLWGLSTSGNSQNVLNAFHVARLRQMPTLLLTGGDGGRLAGLATVAVLVPAQTTMHIQEFHLPIYHALCAALEEAFFPASLH